MTCIQKIKFFLSAVAGIVLFCGMGVAEPKLSPKATDKKGFSLKKLDMEPKEGLSGYGKKEIAKFKTAVEKEPSDRSKRFKLVRALMVSKQFDAALLAAQEWRKVDAYNLVVVRLIGDILSELGQSKKARRAYSAVVELLPKDASAHRALATVLKQNGDYQTAYQRLSSAAELRPEDMRLAFELADAAGRIGKEDEALERFNAIIVNADTNESVRYPAKQRLAQIYARRRVAALKRSDAEQAKQLKEKIRELRVKGGAQNDIKVYLIWDTDGSDVDLWVTNPKGETVSYRHKTGSLGGALFDDVTTGYGPESFTATRARKGKYLVQVNYYGTNRAAFTEARGEVVVVLKEGSENEQRHVLPYRLYHPKQTVSVAEIGVQ